MEPQKNTQNNLMGNALEISEKIPEGGLEKVCGETVPPFLDEFQKMLLEGYYQQVTDQHTFPRKADDFF